MNIKLSNSVPIKNSEIKKGMLTVSLIFTAMNVFLGLVEKQYAQIVPRTLYASALVILFISVGMLVFGWWLSKYCKSKYQTGLFTAVFILLTSIHCLIGTNILYMAEVYKGLLNETIEYSRFSLIIYFSVVFAVTFIMFILSSPKLLFREIKTVKSYFLTIFGGFLFIAIPYIILMVIMNLYFTNPEAVKSTYKILMISIFMGYNSLSLLIYLYRSNKAKLK